MKLEHKNLDESQNSQLNINVINRELLPDLTLDEIFRIAEYHLKCRMLIQ